MNYPTCSSLLRNYFSSITYIDDQFDESLIDEPLLPVEDLTDVPLPEDFLTNESFSEGESISITETDGIPELGAVQMSYLNLSKVLLRIGAEEKFNGIQISPVLYDNSTNEDLIVNKMQKAPLSIIDWDLGNGKTAFPIVAKLFNQSQQLKVVVVYTNDINSADTGLQKDESFTTYEGIPCSKESVYCYQNKHKSLLIIASKQKYNLMSLLDFIIDLYIDCCGLMPSALFSVVEQINNNSGNLFECFSKPFEDIYFLQMFFSELNKEDLPDALVNFVLSKIQSGIHIAPEILAEMHLSVQNRLINLADEPAIEGEERIRTGLRAISPYLKDVQKEFCEALISLPYSDYRICLEKCKTECSTWEKVLRKFETVVSKANEIVINNKFNEFFRPYSNLSIPEDQKEIIDKHNQEVIKKIQSNIWRERKTFQKQVIPVFIQTLISGTGILSAGVELVSNLKYHVYNCEVLTDLLPHGNIPNIEDRAKFLMNKIHFGDILVKRSESESEYLLCITPPCDVFRPKKTEMMVSFIRGKEISNENLDNPRKDNVHLSALPANDSHGNKCLTYIEWRYFDLKKFDLTNDVVYRDFSSYKRPFMLDEQYMRQIANKFTSYFSRAGVEEVFMKEEKNLIKMFL